MRRALLQGHALLPSLCQDAVSTSSPGLSAVMGGRLRRLATGAATTAAGTSSAGADTASSSGWNPFAAIMFVPSAICGCLAYWQYERMQWKDDLIRKREGIASADPRDVFSLDEPKDYDKVLVRGRYLPEYSLYVGPRPRSVPGAGIQSGYLVVTPVVAEDRKGVVLVNRGWVPAWWREEAQAAAEATLRQRAEVLEAKKKQKQEGKAATSASSSSSTKAASSTAAPASSGDAAQAASRSWWWPFGGGRATPAAAPAEKEAQAKEKAAVPELDAVVVGVIQPDEAANRFMPGNQPESDEFHYIQREALAQALGLPPDTPLVMAISADPATAVSTHKRSPLQEARSAAGPGGRDEPGDGHVSFPQPKNVDDLLKFATMPGDHFNYALIWVTLCVALAAMARTAVTRPLRGPRIVEGTGQGARDAWKASQAS